MSQDPGSTQTDAPANPKTGRQRSSGSGAEHSEYSLFELETFFTRWAPDSDPAAARGGPPCPPCPLAAGNSAGRDARRVILVDAEPQSGLRPPQGSVSAAGRLSRRRSHSPGAVQQAVSRGQRSPVLCLCLLCFRFHPGAETIMSGTDD